MSRVAMSPLGESEHRDRICGAPLSGLILLLILGCAGHPRPAPLTARQLAEVSDRSVVVGRLISPAVPDAEGWPHVVIVDTAGRPYKLIVHRLSRAGMSMKPGDRITAWCHGAGGELVADSVRVEKP